ncbi:hypothetical protein MUY27_04475 [Mucilaginibacter sp. RS28]|uniref:DUF4468 domain-containing protein n=1 Tax=Mucilaginibacter straminoryzae TaxID=2932774 RepID=A0A9X2BAN4_9SPHI|nr:hypothetical protein [Mucilaginibacter straminoryzae]MCJ8208952.1 hypothetical protein [Mucilaginibacter straminoryzae]
MKTAPITKLLFSIALFAIPSILFAEDKPTTAKKVALPAVKEQIMFTDTIQLNMGATAEKTVELTQEWFKNHMVSKKAGVLTADKTNGVFAATNCLILPDVTFYNFPVSPLMKYQLDVTVADGKAIVKVSSLKSVFNAFGEVQIPVEDEYNSYLSGANKKGSFRSRENYNKRADLAFSQLNSQVNGIFKSIEDALKTGNVQTMANENKVARSK